MISINCPIEEEVVNYTDATTGVTKTYTIGKKDWDLMHWVDNSTQKGIMQRTHEEEMMLKGEVLLDQDYGINWQKYMDNLNSFSTTEDENNVLDQFFTQQLKNEIIDALYNIEEIYTIKQVERQYDPQDKKKIKFLIQFTYFNGQELVLEEGVITK